MSALKWNLHYKPLLDRKVQRRGLAQENTGTGVYLDVGKYWAYPHPINKYYFYESEFCSRNEKTTRRWFQHILELKKY